MISWEIDGNLKRMKGVKAHSSCAVMQLQLYAKVFKQGYRYHKFRKAFSMFYCRHYELISKFNVGLKSVYIKAYRNQNIMVPKYTNSKRV